jgi:hypothetical protein
VLGRGEKVHREVRMIIILKKLSDKYFASTRVARVLESVTTTVEPIMHRTHYIYMQICRNNAKIPKKLEVSADHVEAGRRFRRLLSRALGCCWIVATATHIPRGLVNHSCPGTVS